MFNLTKRTNCYCAFCRSPRKVHRKKNISLANILVSAVGAVALAFLIFKEFHALSFVLFISFLVISEAFVTIRWRASMACKYCGFDPLIYIKDTHRAVEKVKVHLAKRKNDPASLLAQPLNLPRVNPKSEEIKHQMKKQAAVKKSKGKAGSIISRQI